MGGCGCVCGGFPIKYTRLEGKTRTLCAHDGGGGACRVRDLRGGDDGRSLDIYIYIHRNREKKKEKKGKKEREKEKERASNERNSFSFLPPSLPPTHHFFPIFAFIPFYPSNIHRSDRRRRPRILRIARSSPSHFAYLFSALHRSPSLSTVPSVLSLPELRQNAYAYTCAGEQHHLFNLRPIVRARALRTRTRVRERERESR